MKTVFVNLPFLKRLVRRYTCSYYAPNFLFPPLELMYLAAIVERQKKDTAMIIDAIAEGLTLREVIERCRLFQPDLFVFMTGLETFSSDLEAAEKVKLALPYAKTVCLGYLPTQFPGEILKNVPFIDFIIMDEPEMPFSSLYDKLKDKESVRALSGIAGRADGQIDIGPKAERIKDPDILPFPARHLVKNHFYHEFFSSRPFTTIQASRGCPSLCTYCIRTFGQKVGFRSLTNILEEIKEAMVNSGIKTFRFIDDNFCMDKSRVREFCELILSNKIKFQWACLSRVDSLDQELLTLMKRAGCFRIYFGIETFSKRVLDIYQKGYHPDRIFPLVTMVKKANIEAAGFFMIGGIQTEEEFERDIRLAKKTALDYITAEKVIPYPGTPLFEQMKDEIDFQLFPYKNRLKDAQEEIKIFQWEKEFYSKFYIRPGYMLRMLMRSLRFPKDAIIGLKDIWSYSRHDVDLTSQRADLI